MKKIVFSQKGESFWNKPISFTFPPPYFSSVAKQCHVTYVQAALSKANIPSYASLITQPPYAAPKPTFLAFWGLALSSPVSFHISPDRDDSSCPHTAPPVSHSSREAIPKGKVEQGPRERHLPTHVLESSGGSTTLCRTNQLRTSHLLKIRGFVTITHSLTLAPFMHKTSLLLLVEPTERHYGKGKKMLPPSPAWSLRLRHQNLLSRAAKAGVAGGSVQEKHLSGVAEALMASGEEEEGCHLLQALLGCCRAHSKSRPAFSITFVTHTTSPPDIPSLSFLALQDSHPI